MTSTRTIATARGGWGLYNDEGSTGIRLENNLVYNTTTGGYHQHYGRENLVRNNIFAFSRNGQVAAIRAEPHLSFTFELTSSTGKAGRLLAGIWADTNFRLDHNLYFEAGARPVTFAGQSLNDWRKRTGQDRHSQVADPLFVDAEHLDFRLKPDSPALPWASNPSIRPGPEYTEIPHGSSRPEFPYRPRSSHLNLHPWSSAMTSRSIRSAGATIFPRAVASHEGRPS